MWFHVLYHRNKRADVGRVPEAAIEAQMDVLNASLKRHGLTFTLAGITYTNKKFWSRRCYKPGAERQAKQALAVDTARNLNIYTCSPKRFLGYAYYPKGSAGRWWDGVTVHHSTLPGGKIRFYNEGDTVVHEVGRSTISWTSQRVDRQTGTNAPETIAIPCSSVERQGTQPREGTGARMASDYQDCEP